MPSKYELAVKRKRAIICTPLLIMGCATWYHPTASRAEFSRDRSQCSMYAQQASPTVQTPYNPYLTPMQQANQSIYQGTQNSMAAVGQGISFNDCMQAKGYSKQ